MIDPEELAFAMVSDPLARRYVAKVSASSDNRVRTAADVLGERLVRLAGTLVSELKQPGALVMPQLEREGSRLEAVTKLVLRGGSAVPYLWTEEVRTTALRSLRLPRHVVSAGVLPHPRMWWTFETGIDVGGVLTHQGESLTDGTADAMLVYESVGGINSLTMGAMKTEAGEERPCIFGAGIPYGSTYPDDFGSAAAPAAHVTTTLTMLAFLASPYIPQEVRRVDRAARREAIRAGKPVDDDAVTFVTLRRPEGGRRERGEETDVNWQHRWLVNGHVRAQWYPSEQAHRLIWIAPYIKGPPDAPMLEHAYKVAR